MARSRAAFSLVLSTVLVSACGQITGLSDDYTYDLGAPDGATSEGGTGDATIGDGSSGGDVTTNDGGDSGLRCTDAQRSAALGSMTQMKNDTCKTCLATRCCTAVQACTAQTSGCRVTLSCHLDCSEKGNPQQCFNAQCMNGTDVTFQAVRSCATSFCKNECVL